MTLSPGGGASGPASATSARAAAPLLERDRDLATLRELLEAARGGNGGLAIVEGSAGMGKTRLLAETRATGTELGFRILSARGGELESEFAFGLVRQLFEPLLAQASAEERAELLNGAAGLAAPLFGETALVEAPASGEASYAVLHGLYWLAANAAAQQPALLLVDDLQWGDAPSLRFLDHMARRLEGLPLALVAATRPPDLAGHGPLLTELLMDPAAVVLRPGALGIESVAALARDTFGTEPDEAFAAACRAASGGNPLYLRAILTTLHSEGLAPTAANTGRVEEVGPEPVVRAVGLRLARLPAEAGALAAAIAVLGQTAELGLAGSLAELDRAAAHAAAAGLVRGELIRLEPSLDFVHPVVRAAIYDGIDAHERAETHRRAAVLLTGSGAEPERPASHLLLVPPADDPFVLDAMRGAARSALARGSAGEAVVYLRRALAEPPPPGERGALLGELGEVERSVDLPAAIEHLREAVGLIEQPSPAFGDAALQYARALASAGTDSARAIESYSAAIHAAIAGNRPRLVEVATAELINASWTEAAHLDTAKTLLVDVRDDRLSGGFASDYLLALLAHWEVRRGADRGRAVQLARRALAGGALAQESTQGIAYALDALRAAGEHEAALAGYASALASARKRGDLLDAGVLLGARGRLLLDAGDLRAAEPDLRESIEFSAEHGTAVHLMVGAALLADYLLETGDVDGAERALARTGLPEQLPPNVHFTILLGARGRLRLARREPEAALAGFEAAGRIAAGLELANPAEWPWRTGAAAALLALGRDEEARVLAAEELALARAWGAARPVGVALRLLGLAERSAERLRESLELLAASPARLDHAKTLLALGRAVDASGGRDEARGLIEQAAELAARCGATALAAQAGEELAAAGGRPRKVSLTGLDALTASERRVAQLAADELSNKEIAQTLFVTVKTVELHLSNAYRKLGIASRRDLPAALTHEQPVPA